MAVLHDGGQPSSMLQRAAPWAIPLTIAAILWGGSTEYRVQATSAQIEKNSEKITVTGETVSRIDERLKGIKEALDEIKRSIANRP